MNRKLKALGLALFAALALSAVAASTAAAVNTTDHITANPAVEWTPTVSAINTQEFRTTTKEEKPNFKCKKVAATVTAAVPATTDNITVTPEYSECELENAKGEKATAFVLQEGCDYQFTGKTTTGNLTANGEHATVHIKNHLNPLEPCEIEIKVTSLKLKCISIPNQEVKDAVRYEQGGAPGTHDIVINATAHGFINTTTNSVACPTKTGETETHTDGSYVGKVTVKAHNELKEPVQLTLTEAATP